MKEVQGGLTASRDLTKAALIIRSADDRFGTLHGHRDGPDAATVAAGSAEVDHAVEESVEPYRFRMLGSLAPTAGSAILGNMDQDRDKEERAIDKRLTRAAVAIGIGFVAGVGIGSLIGWYVGGLVEAAILAALLATAIAFAVGCGIAMGFVFTKAADSARDLLEPCGGEAEADYDDGH